MKNIIPLLIMAFFSVLSFITSLDYIASMGGMIKIFTGICFYVLIYNNVRTINDATKILVVIMLASIVPMIYGYYQYMTATGHAWKGYFYAGHRIDSVMGQYNDYGIFLCFCIVVTLILFFCSKTKKMKFFTLIMIVSQVTSLFFSLNRGSWVCLSAALLVSVLCHRKFIRLRWLIVVSVVVISLFSSLIIQRFDELRFETPGGYSQNTLHSRVNAWKKIVPLILKKPITGYGLDSSMIVTKKYLNTELAPHNDYLRLALESGVLSLTFYVIFLLIEFTHLMLASLWQKYSFVNFPFFALIIYFCLISFFQNIIYNQVLFPMVLCILALSRRFNEILDGDKDPIPAPATSSSNRFKQIK